MRIADKVFTSLIQRQAQSKTGAQKSGPTYAAAKKQAADKTAKEAVSPESGREASDATVSLDAGRSAKLIDDLVRDQIQAQNGETREKKTELLAQVENMSPAERHAVLSELKTREDQLRSVLKTNQSILPDRYIDFLA